MNPIGELVSRLQLRRRDGEWHVVEPPMPMRWGVLTERLDAFARGP